MVRGRRRRAKPKPSNDISINEDRTGTTSIGNISFTNDSVKSPSIKKYFKPETNKSSSNIFLQEPVLKLNLLDCSSNEESKNLLKYGLQDFSNDNEFSNISKGLVTIGPNHENVCKLLIEEKIVHTPNNSTSCLNDSGNQTPSKKSTTPHRILCPSPDKKIPRVVDSTFKTRLEQKLCSPEVTKEHSNDNNKSDENKISNPSANPTAQQNNKNNKLKATGGNTKLTEYFTIRRSSRKTKKEVQNEILRSYEQAVLQKVENGLEVRLFEKKGRGVVATRNFAKGEFVVEYVGELISMAEANKREAKYAKDDNAGCYMYYFKHNDQQYCIDATDETGRLGRLVNHSRNGNLTTKTILVHEEPHLVLIAKYDIKKGEELTYDYGDRSKESLLHHPWLAF